MTTTDLATLRARLSALQGVARGDPPYSTYHDHAIDLACRALEAAVRYHGVGPLRLEWFSDEPDKGYVMVASPRVVHVNRNLLKNPYELLVTVGHEAYHSWAHLTDQPFGPEEETKADEEGRRLAAQFC